MLGFPRQDKSLPRPVGPPAGMGQDRLLSLSAQVLGFREPFLPMWLITAALFCPAIYKTIPTIPVTVRLPHLCHWPLFLLRSSCRHRDYSEGDDHLGSPALQVRLVFFSVA